MAAAVPPGAGGVGGTQGEGNASWAQGRAGGTRGHLQEGGTQE